MKEWFQRYDSMIQELSKSPSVLVLTNTRFPGVTTSEIQEVEDFLGYKLNQNIISFFEESNGLQLRWINKSNKAYNPEYHLPDPDHPIAKEKIIEDDGRMNGCINILPLRDVFINDLWYDMIYFESDTNDSEISFAGAKVPELDFLSSIRPFDYYHYSSDMAFILAFNTPSPFLSKGQDHQADYFNSLRVSFEAYMEYIVKYFGTISSRASSFHTVEGHLKAPITSVEQIPKPKSFNFDNPK